MFPTLTTAQERNAIEVRVSAGQANSGAQRNMHMHMACLFPDLHSRHRLSPSNTLGPETSRPLNPWSLKSSESPRPALTTAPLSVSAGSLQASYQLLATTGNGKAVDEGGLDVRLLIAVTLPLSFYSSIA